jgi:hypothetical protein
MDITVVEAHPSSWPSSVACVSLIAVSALVVEFVVALASVASVEALDSSAVVRIPDSESSLAVAPEGPSLEQADGAAPRTRTIEKSLAARRGED